MTDTASTALKPFSPRASNHLYCSVECRIPDRPCAHCGRPFSTRQKKVRFCSIKCAAAAKVTRSLDRHCTQCGTVFTVPRRNSPVRTCSPLCRRMSRPRKAWPKKQCQFCGGDMLPFRQKAKFCSRSCASKSYAKLQKGRYPVGTRLIKNNGYISLKTADGSWALEHRYVMARQLGRPLESTEHVHHVNGDRTDNSPENLQLRHGQHGKGICMRCIDCGSHNVTAVPLGRGDTQGACN